MSVSVTVTVAVTVNSDCDVLFCFAWIRDSIHVEWMFKDRQFLLVDTAGLTKISVDNRLLKDAEELKRVAHMESTGKFVEKLPGVEVCTAHCNYDGLT